MKRRKTQAKCTEEAWTNNQIIRGSTCDLGISSIMVAPGIAKPMHSMVAENL